MIETDFPTQEQFDGFVRFLTKLVDSLPRLAAIVVLTGLSVFLLWRLMVLILRFFSLRQLLQRDMIFLELTPPAFSNKTPIAGKRFFTDLHGFDTIRAIRTKLLMQQVAFSVEVVGTREHGVRFIFCVPKENRDSFKNSIKAFDTNIQVQEIEDYLTKAQRLRALLLEFRLKDKYHPLQQFDSFTDDDPVDYLLRTMSDLKPGEIMVLQLVLSPTEVPNADKIRKRLLHNQEHLDELGRRHHKSVGGTLASGISSFLLGITSTVGDVYHGPTRSGKYHSSQNSIINHKQQAASGIRPSRDMGSLEEGLAEKVDAKLEDSLFRANIRALVVAGSSRNSRARANDIRKSFAVYKTKYQEVKSRLNIPVGLQNAYRLFMFEHRLPSLLIKNTGLLSAAEASSIYHFPNSEANYNGDVPALLSKTLPAPLTIRNYADKNAFDVVIGRNYHQGKATDIGLVGGERERHLYIIGGTGNGKSTLMKYAIIQDIKNGKGVAVIDPHGDLAQELLRHIPEERLNDVVYFNPADLKRPVGFNLLQMPKGLDDDERLMEQNRIVDAIISIFRKVFSDDEKGGHRIEDVLRNSIETAMTIKGATLFTVLKLLRNKRYRKRIIAGLEDEFLKDFWREELGSAGDMQRVSMSKGVTMKIDRFRASPPARRVLEQSKSTINFEDIMNSGKILICNFSEEIGEDTSALFGTTVLAELKIAAQRRANIDPSERKPFYLYVDEFQNFATSPFIKMLSSLRKYKVYLTIAEQSTAQQENQRMVEAILSNVNTIVCFRAGSPADEQLLLQRFTPFLEPGEIMNLPTYHFYARLSAMTSQPPVSGVTVVPDIGDKEIADRVLEASRQNYGHEYVSKKKPTKPVADQNKPEVSQNTENTDDGESYPDAGDLAE